MDPLTQWADIMGIIAGTIALIYFILHIIRNINAIVEVIADIVDGIIGAIGDWWDDWGAGCVGTIGVLLLIGCCVVFGISAFSNNGSSSSSSSSSQAYTANLPGSGCDTGSGQWEKSPDVSVTCDSNDVTLTYTGDGTHWDSLFFFGSDNNHESFPRNYSVELTVTFPDASGASVGVGAHGFSSNDVCGQMGWISLNGYWELDRYKATDFDTKLDSGSLSANSSTYTIDLTYKDSSITLVINGATVSTVTDSTYSQTSDVCVGIAGSSKDTVTVSDFKFTPLS